MKKVTTINLSGNAYQLEESAYELLKKYLEQAKKNLADDPDKDEILTDFERAIADKCDSHLGPRKNVVSEKEVQKIIEDMGPVEPADDSEKKAETVGDKQTKRLYTLPEGAMIGGVANGFAAYVNVDVTIIRLIFVVFAFVTSGAAILGYLLMMLVLPEARTPEQKAELRGEKFSAQDVLGRAKQKYAEIGSGEHLRKRLVQTKPLFANIGNIVERIVRLAVLICGVLGLLFSLALTLLWMTGLSWLVFSHPHFTDQLSTISHWTIGAAMTATYFLLVLPIQVVAIWLLRTGLRRPSPRKQNLGWLIGVGGLWLVAIMTLITVSIVAGQRVHDYYETNGTITINHQKECINNAVCWGAYDGSRFMPDSGSEYICRKSYCKWGPGGGDFQPVIPPAVSLPANAKN